MNDSSSFDDLIKNAKDLGIRKYFVNNSMPDEYKDMELNSDFKYLLHHSYRQTGSSLYNNILEYTKSVPHPALGKTIVVNGVSVFDQNVSLIKEDPIGPTVLELD